MALTTETDRPPSPERHAASGERRTGPCSARSSGFARFIDERTGPIGRVVGSEREPAGSHSFCIWAADDAITLDVGHIVVAFSEEAAVIGVVDEPRRFSDLRSFLDDYFDRRIEDAIDAELPTRRPEILVFAVDVLAHPAPARRRRLAPAAGQRSGLLRHPRGDRLRARQGRVHRRRRSRRCCTPTATPSGTSTASHVATTHGDVVFQRSPIWLDERLPARPRGRSRQLDRPVGSGDQDEPRPLPDQRRLPEACEAEGKTVAALMFNVKGPDLLWLDKPADAGRRSGRRLRGGGVRSRSATRIWRRTRRSVWSRSRSTELPHLRAVQTGPGAAAARASSTSSSSGQPTTSRSTRCATRAPKPSACVFPILWQLDAAALDAAQGLRVRRSRRQAVRFHLRDPRRRGIASMNQLDELFDEIDAHFEDEPGARSEWNGHHKFTIQKARNRFKGLPDKFGGLLSDGMVDYGNLPQVDDSVRRPGAARRRHRRLQHQRAGDRSSPRSIDEVWKMAEQQKLGVDKVVVFVDELNKYAPAAAQGGLRDTLVDIAARGRHLNVVLFGAEQFRSKVDRRDPRQLRHVVLRPGRRRGDHQRRLSLAQRDDQARAARVCRKGRLLVRHAHFRAPLFGTFPRPPTFPAWSGSASSTTAPPPATAPPTPAKDSTPCCAA